MEIQIISVCLAALVTSGCVTTPTPAEGVASASSVGDRARVIFDETVVSLRFRGANAPYQNLHVALTAFINPIRKTSADPYYAQGIVQRCEPRIAVKISQALSTQGELSLEDTERLRQLVRTEAQAIVDEAIKRWEHGSAYNVEVAVASIYWTDASVGQPHCDEACGELTTLQIESANDATIAGIRHRDFIPQTDTATPASVGAWVAKHSRCFDR